ncbi:MAG: DUF4340 domain-containing protein [Leptospiraceae bacterium]|nr:DUF4340 domain-containing protein [Leptospiraceae bacterium]
MDKLKTFLFENRAFSLSLLNLVLVLFIFFVNDPFSLFVQTYEKAEPFFKVKAASIESIKIEKADEEIKLFTLQKKGSTWLVEVNSKTLLANGTRAEALVDSLLKARKFTEVSSSKEKASEYGFNSGSIKITVNTNNTLHLGSVKTGSNFTHVKQNESDRIFLVEDNLKSIAGRGKFDFFLDKNLSPAGTKNEEINKIIFRQEGKKGVSYKLELSDKNWKLLLPKTGEIPSSEMTAILSRISGLEADSIELNDDYKANLDETFKASLQYSKKKEKTGSMMLSFSILGKHKKENHFYVQKEGSDTVYRLSEFKCKYFYELQPEEKIKK